MSKKRSGVFSQSVLNRLNQKVREDIRKSITGSPEMAKEIKRVLQMANRRAQNIEKSGVASPSYQALILEGRTGYSKFTITGTDLSNKAQWERAVYEYSQAVAFLNNPTSTATGARQYVKNIADKKNITFEMANALITESTSLEFKDGKIPLLHYRSIIDDFRKESNEDRKEMKKDADLIEKQLKNSVEEYSKEMSDKITDTVEEIGQNLKKGFRLK